MNQKPALIRSLGLGDATLLIIGCIVGVGIFRTTSSIAEQVPSALLILSLWALGGMLSLCGALCYAELAAMFPASGGDYVYIRETYGRFWGFLFAWAKLFVERTGTIAILGVVFAEYTGRILRYSQGTLHWVAASAIALLTIVNIIGIRWGKYVQNVFTVIKMGALICVILAGAYSAVHTSAHITLETVVPSDGLSIQSIALALIFVLWAYGGWSEAGYVAEEIRNSTRNVPYAIIVGVLCVTGLYLLVNWSYLTLLPVDVMQKSPLVASRAMQEAIGQTGKTFISWMVACSAFGALNGYILTGGRILYAVGKDHSLFAHLGRVQRTFHTPALALCANALIAIGLVFTKTFEQVVTYSSVVISVFSAMAVLGVIILRRRKPQYQRPYRSWGYPVTPVVFLVTITVMIIGVCLEEPREAMFGFGLLAIGLPLYWISSSYSRWSAG